MIVLVYGILRAMAAQPDAQEKTVAYLAGQLSQLVKKMDTVLICFPEQGDGSLSHAMEQAVLRNRQRVENYQRIFRHLNPQSRLNDRRQRLMEIEERLRIGMLDAAKSELAIRTQKLEGVSPLRQLERGYAYVSDEEGHGITSAGQVTKGQRLLLDVRDGRIESEVTAVKKRMS